MNSFRHTLIALLLTLPALLAAGAAAAQIPRTELENLRRDLLAGMNRARALTDMAQLQYNLQLQNAAQSHADYLAEHGQTGHEQGSRQSLFTGTWPEDRVAAAGYSSRTVWEIASTHPAEINGLNTFMASVYHRLLVLNPAADEAGIGIARRGDKLVQVVKFGQSQWRRLCEQRLPSNQDPNRTLLGQCADESRAVPVGRIESLNENILRAQPQVILWPPDQYRGLETRLTDESPSPLPGRTLLGNALTVQFNTSRDLPGVEAWQLLELNGDNVRGVAVELMTPASDPNQLLGPGQYALVPAAPLKYGTDYRARLKYQGIRGPADLEWGFSTAPLPWPVLNLGGDEKIWLTEDQAYLLRLSGKGLKPSLDQLKVFSPDGIRVRFERPMQDILLARFSGEPCAGARIEYAALPTTRLQMAPPDEELGFEESCREILESSLPGRLIFGNGDVLELAAGEPHLISLVPESDRDTIGRLRWVAPAGCEVTANFQSALTSRISLDCRSGSQVRFSLSKGRFFRVIVR